jgi:hypothetical protein
MTEESDKTRVAWVLEICTWQKSSGVFNIILGFRSSSLAKGPQRE